MNKMEVQEYCPTFMAGMDRDTVILLSALAAKVTSWRGMGRQAEDGVPRGQSSKGALSTCKPAISALPSVGAASSPL